MDDATIGEAMLLDIVLHNMVVMVGVNPDIPFFGEGVFHDVMKHMMDIWITGDAMDDMIGLFIIEPLAIVNLRISRLRRGKECEVCDHSPLLHHDKAAAFFHIGKNDIL